MIDTIVGVAVGLAGAWISLLAMNGVRQTSSAVEIAASGSSACPSRRAAFQRARSAIRAACTLKQNATVLSTTNIAEQVVLCIPLKAYKKNFMFCEMSIFERLRKRQ